MSELDPGGYVQPGQVEVKYVVLDPNWLTNEIRRTQEMVRELPAWLGGPCVGRWHAEWTGNEGWFWFYGRLKRGRQTFSRDMSAICVDSNGLFKGPRGLAFFAHDASGLWLELQAPRKPTALEIAKAWGIDVKKFKRQEDLIDALTGKRVNND